MLQEFLDKHGDYYVCRVDKKFRSRVNTIFRIEGDRSLEDKFIKEAEANKCVNTRGHPFNSGIRICMYNAMPVEGVKVLLAFMERFKNDNPVKGPTLYYFDLFGRGEPIRMALWKAGVKFEDKRVTGQAWADLKASGKLEFGQLPMLEYSDGT